MSVKNLIRTLEKHGREEVRIHNEILKEATGDLKNLTKKHLKDTMKIHKIFWNDLKKSLK